MDSRAISNYSMWSLLCDGRKTCEWSHHHEPISLERDRNLALGTAIRPCARTATPSSRPRLPVRDKVIQIRNNYGLAIMNGARKRHPDNRKTFVSLLVGERATI